jgi:hypothetical protein
MVENSVGNPSLLDRFSTPQSLVDGLMHKIEATEVERTVLQLMVSSYLQEASEDVSHDEIVARYPTIGYNLVQMFDDIISLEFPTALVVLREKQSDSFAVIPGQAPDEWDDSHEVYESHVDFAEWQLKELFDQNHLAYLRTLLSQNREEDAGFKDSGYWKG